MPDFNSSKPALIRDFNILQTCVMQHECPRAELLERYRQNGKSLENVNQMDPPARLQAMRSTFYLPLLRLQEAPVQSPSAQKSSSG